MSEHDLTDEARERRLEEQLWAVLNNKAMSYASRPYVVATVLAKVLVVLVKTDANDYDFGLRLIEDLQRALVSQVGQPETSVGQVH